ncbi:ABC transporter permease subunit [Nocardioides sp. ChNu-153]|uniref:ABC transporter permease n=1 Tax=unclassified Nocardioides TaxID=2615069 RepID=UPI0024067C3F|nr:MULTISPECIES: ABC transporter permease subunit [unclassified Nocardioides]MDF9714581.1 ABC transporter permease subunit [Nocardioides sp. ChNu-99]MDN7119886.1 ABC transporter permease subunit [Nocardioides sp. ChNu-153]
MRWLSQNHEQVLELTLTHLALSVPAILASLLLAVPLGWLAHHVRRARGPLLVGVGLLYAIPSLPLFIIVPVLAGTPLRSAATMVIVLTVYGVAVLVRSAADAFASVPAPARDAATAMGYSRTSAFWRVELPLAGPVLLAGLRVVTVSTVSLVSVGAVIGISSLGTLFTDGFQRGIRAEVLTGLVLVVVLAVLLDAVCVLVGRTLMPWSRPARRTRRTRGGASAVPVGEAA